MHIERIHKMIEKLTECALCEIEKGIECVNTEEMGEVIDMIKDLSEAEYKSLIAKEMKEYKEEEEAEEKYMMRKLKEDYKDDYKRMKDEYGEDEGERRFYDNYRYMRTGRFAPKGRGTYVGRRGYTEMMPMDYRMPDVYGDDEWYRDMDRETRGKMYYTGSNMMNMSDGRSNSNNRSESRYDRARRGYEETKMTHKGNTPEDKQLTMKEMEKVLNVVFDEIDEMLEDAPPEMKNMVKTKGMTRFQKIQ